MKTLKIFQEKYGIIDTIILTLLSFFSNAVHLFSIWVGYIIFKDIKVTARLF